MGRFLAPPSVGHVPPRAEPPSFSVLIPAYNAAGFIGEAVESALSQRPAPLEVIVCDDGSTDDLAGALAPFGERITLVRQENQGEGVAKTTAARAASGEFVSLLDSDDYYLPGRLDALGQLACARPDLDILTTDAYIVEDGVRLGTYYGGCATFVVEDQARATIPDNFIFGMAAVRRERLLAVGGWEGNSRYACDWQGWLRLVLTGSAVGLVDEPLAAYVRHAGAISTRRAEMGEARIAILRALPATVALDAQARADVDAFLAWQERRIPVERLAAGLQRRDPGVRREAWALCRAPGVARPDRLFAALAAAAPGLTASVRAWAGSTPCGEPRPVLDAVRASVDAWWARGVSRRTAGSGRTAR